MHESSRARDTEAESAKKGAGGKLISADRNLRRLINGQPIFGLRAPSLLLPSAAALFFSPSLFIARVLYIDHRRRRVTANGGG